jgi:CubicO group peptidase (beta-lactamase class C family)
MRFAITVFFLTYICLTASAQSRQQQKADSVFNLVVTYFNAKNPDAIYNMAGENFQRELGINAFADVANHSLFPLGQIKSTSLVSFVNNSVATYKVKFDTMTLQILLSLNAKNKLETLLFQPYAEPAESKKPWAATTNKLKTETDRKVDSVARTYIQKAGAVGLCIGVIKDGQATTYGYGETTKLKDKIPTPDNFFELGSVTKTFTATLLAYYVNAGKVKLTDPITKFLPDSVAANPGLQGITLLNLINHTSGLPRVPDNMDSHASDYLNPYKDYVKPLLYSYLKTCTPSNKPGEQYAYSNLGVGLLGVILSEVSGKTFEQMATEIICKPLGMFSTVQHLNPLMSPRFVTVYNEEGQPTAGWDFDVLAACGALRSTINDMLLYAKANMQTADNQLSKAFQLTHRVTFTKDVKIGMAWYIITVDGVDYYFHNGNSFGSSSFLAFNPEKNIAVVILSNSAENTDKVGLDILKKLQ